MNLIRNFFCLQSIWNGWWQKWSSRNVGVLSLSLSLFEGKCMMHHGRRVGFRVWPPCIRRREKEKTVVDFMDPMIPIVQRQQKRGSMGGAQLLWVVCYWRNHDGYYYDGRLRVQHLQKWVLSISSNQQHNNQRLAFSRTLTLFAIFVWLRWWRRSWRIFHLLNYFLAECPMCKRSFL
jgi:hypothetical protein